MWSSCSARAPGLCAALRLRGFLHSACVKRAFYTGRCEVKRSDSHLSDLFLSTRISQCNPLDTIWTSDADGTY